MSELTKRQEEVFNQLIKGKSNNEIAKTLKISVNTVKVHLCTIFKVLNVHTRAELLYKSLR